MRGLLVSLPFEFLHGKFMVGAVVAFYIAAYAYGSYKHTFPGFGGGGGGIRKEVKLTEWLESARR